jgi:hypothetical protein
MVVGGVSGLVTSGIQRLDSVMVVRHGSLSIPRVSSVAEPCAVFVPMASDRDGDCTLHAPQPAIAIEL